MPKEKIKVDPETKAKRRNFRDVIRDEIYGAAMKAGGEVVVAGKNVIRLDTKDVDKIAKRIARRWLIGPR